MEQDPFSSPPTTEMVTHHVESLEFIGPDGHTFDVETRTELGDPTTATADTTDYFMTDSLLEPGIPDVDGADSDEAGIDRVLVDAGMIDMAPIGKAVDASRISYHGLRFGVARIREQRARDRIAKMDRKDNLYQELTDAADNRMNVPTKEQLSSMSPTEREDRIKSHVSDVLPETVVERSVDVRQTRRQMKASLKELDRGIVAKGYQAPSNQDRRTTLNKLGQTVANASSGKTAYEKQQERLRIRATPTAKLTRTQKAVNGRSKLANSGYERTAVQPVSSSWREYRTQKAANTIRSTRQSADKHLQKAIDIQNN